MATRSTSPFHILHSIDEIELEEPSNAIILLKRRRNSNVAVSCFPTEILSTIFLYTAIGGQNKYGFSSEWISITHVCHFWREVALNSSSMWSRWGIPNAQWTQAFFSRSGQAPLYIRTVLSATTAVESLAGLLQRSNCRDRVQELHISGLAPFLAEILDAFDHCQASDNSANKVSECRVRSISIESRLPGWDLRLPKGFQSLRFPHLQRLELVDCIFDWNSAIFESAVLGHLTIKNELSSKHPPISRLLSVLAKQPLLEELILRNSFDIHPGKTDLFPVNLHHLRLVELEGSASSCFTLMTKLSYPRTQISINLIVSSCHERDFTSHAVPFFSKHYGDHRNRDNPPFIRHLSITRHHDIALHILCAPYPRPPDRSSVHEPSFRLMIHKHFANRITAVTTAAFAVLPLHNVRSLVYSGIVLDYSIWRFSVFDTMNNLEEMALFRANVDEAVLALNLADDRRNATFGEDADHQSCINRGDVKNEVDRPVQGKGPDGVTLSTEDVQDSDSKKSRSTEKDEVIPPILLPKLKTLRIVDADFRCNSFANLTPWLESRQDANCELELLSLETCKFIDSDTVEKYRKLVKELIWDGLLDFESDTDDP